MSSKIPSTNDKLSLIDWLEEFLPFKLPRVPLVQTARNLDKAIAAIVLAAGENVVARIQSSTTRISARSSAERVLIEYGQRQIEGSPDLADRALQYAIGDAITKQRNREEVLRRALEDLQKAPPEKDAAREIDDDWLNLFKEHAEKKNGADIQELWGRILASEIRIPGSISLRTLSFLSTVSVDEAREIVAAFAFVVDGQFIPEWAHDQNYHPFLSVMKLMEIGIVSGSFGIGGPAFTRTAARQANGRSLIAFTYYGIVAMFEMDTPDYIMRIPAVRLTEIGRALFGLSDTKQPNYEFFKKFASHFFKPPVKKISIASILRQEGEVIEFGPAEEICN